MTALAMKPRVDAFAVERRRHARVRVCLAGQFMRENRKEFPCTTIDVSVGGIAFAAETEADVARYEKWLEYARPYQIDARMISGSELDKRVPGGSGRWRTALFCATDGRAEPQRAAPAIARAAQRAGAVILTDCAVRGLDRAGGRVAGVVTERGRIRAETVVVAAGAWSRRFLKDLDITLPQLKVRASVMRTAPLAGGPEAAFWFQGAAYRKRLDGGYTIANGYVNVAPIVPDSFRFFKSFLPALRSETRALRLRIDHRFLQELAEARPVPLDQVSPYEKTRVLDPAPDEHFLRQALTDLSKVFPVFARAQIVQKWAGMIDVTPDAVPVISPVDEAPGLIVATGFSGHGFGIGPGAGRRRRAAPGALLDPAQGDRRGRWHRGEEPRRWGHGRVQLHSRRVVVRRGHATGRRTRQPQPRALSGSAGGTECWGRDQGGR